MFSEFDVCMLILDLCTYIARITAVGIVLGSIQHLFYRALDRRYPARDVQTIAKKIFFDQTLCTPVNIAVFIYGLGILENKTLAKMNDELLEKFIVIFTVSAANQFLKHLQEQV